MLIANQTSFYFCTCIFSYVRQYLEDNSCPRYWEYYEDNSSNNNNNNKQTQIKNKIKVNLKNSKIKENKTNKQTQDTQAVVF